MEEAISTHALSVYYVVHKHAFDLSGSVGATSLVNDWNKWGAGGQIAGRVYITRALTLDGTVTFGYKKNLVNNPAVPNTDYQLLTLMGVGTGSTTTTSTVRVGVTYRFGKTLERQKDTRWQFTSDEVPDNF